MLPAVHRPHVALDGKVREGSSMNAHQCPMRELAELHERFLDMRRTKDQAIRRDLAFQISEHKASQTRLKTACRKMRRGRPKFWLEDVVKEAGLMLVGRIAAPALAFEDRGVPAFAKWYWGVCLSVAWHAWNKVGRGQAVPIESLAEWEIPLLPKPTFVQCCFDDVLQEIRKLPAIEAAVMAAQAAGIPAQQTAEKCGLSASDISRLRKKGLEHLKRVFGTQIAMSQ